MSEIKVTDKNQLTFKNGGLYQMDVAGPEEQMCAKLTLLEHFIELIFNEISANGATYVVHNKAICDLADTIYAEYAKFIENGIDIFDYVNYQDEVTLEKYQRRPIVGKHMNAGYMENRPDIPEGWFYDFPGVLSKYFNFGKLIIDKDTQYRIGIYDLEDESLITMRTVNTIEDLASLSDTFPETYIEIIDCINFLRKNN